MIEISSGKAAQLERIARLLDQSLDSLAAGDAGMAILGELLGVWPRLTDSDRRDVLALAEGRAERCGSGKLSE